MTSPDFSQMRDAMIEGQLRPSGVCDPGLLAVLRDIRRETFVPAAAAALAYRDAPVEVTTGRFLPSPLVDARLAAELKPLPSERVLVVGGATGYLTAILAPLAGHVTHVETDRGLLDRARAAVAAANVDFVEAPLASGHAAGAPYDILVIDGMVEELPQALVGQLRDGGRIGAVMAGRGEAPSLAVGRLNAGHIGWTRIIDVTTPVLPGFERAKVFEF